MQLLGHWITPPPHTHKAQSTKHSYTKYCCWQPMLPCLCAYVFVHKHKLTNCHSSDNNRAGGSHLVILPLILPQPSFWPLWLAGQTFVPALLLLSQKIKQTPTLWSRTNPVLLSVNKSEFFLVSDRWSQTDLQNHCVPRAHVYFGEWPWCSQTTF